MILKFRLSGSLTLTAREIWAYRDIKQVLCPRCTYIIYLC